MFEKAYVFMNQVSAVALMNATITSVNYLNLVVEPIIKPFAAAIYKRFVFIDDNAP